MSRIKTMLNIKYPIIQGGMQYVSRSPLVIAVSKAGGLGVLTCGALDADGLRQEIQTVRKGTDKPFGVNFNLQQPNIEELIQVACEEKVDVVTTGAGSPKKYLPKFKKAGIKVLPVIAAIKHAEKMEALGVDALIVEGQEAGGHIGKSSTMPLVRAISRVTTLPIVAAGGIADGNGLVAAFALGAEGIQMGTRFIATEECPVPDSFKQAIVNANDLSTIVTGRKGGHPVRAINNKMLTEYEKLEQENTPEEELEKLVVGSLHRAVVEGDAETGTMHAGEVSSLIDEVKPAKAVIEDLISEAQSVLKNLDIL